MSTSATGDYAEYFSPDSGNHDVRTNYDLKDNSGSRSFVFGGVSLAFLYPQTFNFKNAGTLAAEGSEVKYRITAANGTAAHAEVKHPTVTAKPVAASKAAAAPKASARKTSTRKPAAGKSARSTGRR